MLSSCDQRRSRLMRAFCMIAVCGGGVVCVSMSAPVAVAPSVVTARKIVIVDDDGKPRLTLGTAPGGAALVEMFDGRGRSVLRMSSGGDVLGASIELQREGQSGGVSLADLGPAGALVSVASFAGEGTVGLSCSAGPKLVGVPRLVMRDESGVERTELSVGGLALSDRSGGKMVCVGQTRRDWRDARPKAALSILSESGEVVFSAP